MDLAIADEQCQAAGRPELVRVGARHAGAPGGDLESARQLVTCLAEPPRVARRGK